MWASDTITLRPDVLIYVLNLGVIASLICGLNLLVARMCRKRSAPVQYTILASGLALTLLCPVAAWFGQHHGAGFLGVCVGQRPPAVDNPMVEHSGLEPLVVGVTSEPMVYPAARVAKLSGDGYSLRPAIHSDQTRLPQITPIGTLGGTGWMTAGSRTDGNRFTPAWWQLAGTLLVYAWILGIGIGVFRLAIGYRSVIKLRGSLKPTSEAHIPVIAREAAGVLGLRRPPSVLTSDQIPVPISLGVFSPVVILTQDMAREIERAQLTAVLLHEMAHIARRDHLTGLAQRLALILFWWNPLVRRLSHRISQLREEICDNHVLQVQGEGASLAQVLIDVADRAVVGHRLPLAVGMNGPELSGLGKRISRLTNREPNMATRMNRVSSSLVFLSGLVALLGIACVGSLQAFEQDAEEPARPGQREADDKEEGEGSSGFLDISGKSGKGAGAKAPSVVKEPSTKPRAKKGSTTKADSKAKASAAELPPPKQPAKSRSTTKADFKAEYQFDFRGSKFDRGTLMPFGFDSLYGLQLLKPEARGLRVIIPHHQGRDKPLVGVLPLFKVHGDFEITAGCELLAAEAPAVSFVAGANLYIFTEESRNGAVLRRGVDSDGEQVYFVYYSFRDDDGKSRRKLVCFPAEGTTAKLRLARKGSTLRFLVAQEDSEEFRELHQIEYGEENVGLIRLETTTEGAPINVDMLWKDITIRAEELKPANVPLFRAGMFDAEGSPAALAVAAAPRTYVEPAAPVAQSVGIRIFEPFDGGLTLDWNVVRPDPTHVSLTKNPGKLTITTQPGGIWESTGDEAKNLCLVHNPMAEGGDFVITTCIESFRPTMKWQQAGLLIYDDDDNYLKCAMEAGDGNPRLALVRESDAEAQSDIDQTGVETEKIWIRIIKRGKSYERAYSIDGTKFVSAGAAVWGDGAPKRIGVFAKNGTGQEPETDAAFDFFEVRSPRPAETDRE